MIENLIEMAEEEPRIKNTGRNSYIFKESTLGISINKSKETARIFCLGSGRTMPVEKLLEYGMCEKWIRDFIMFNMDVFSSSNIRKGAGNE